MLPGAVRMGRKSLRVSGVMNLFSIWRVYDGMRERAGRKVWSIIRALRYPCL